MVVAKLEVRAPPPARADLAQLDWDGERVPVPVHVSERALTGRGMQAGMYIRGREVT